MRPLKDIFIEEYWAIGFRNYNSDNSLVNAEGVYDFDVIKGDARYWYADPFLFKKDGRTYLFFEAFDNITEQGVIGVSEYKNGIFTKPEIILRETFHLSYPFVFEKDGDIFMMPETHEDNCVQLYKAVSFPEKWEKYKVLIKDVNAVDTVIENNILITSGVCPENDMSVDLCLFDLTGKELACSPVYKSSFTKRGAGRVFDFNGKRIRPSQSCENSSYGQKLYFNLVNQCDTDGYSEELYSQIVPQNLSLKKSNAVYGIHTYARTGEIEVIDVKLKRVNLKRIFWIIKKKFGI